MGNPHMWSWELGLEYQAGRSRNCSKLLGTQSGRFFFLITMYIFKLLIFCHIFFKALKKKKKTVQILSKLLTWLEAHRFVTLYRNVCTIFYILFCSNF